MGHMHHHGVYWLRDSLVQGSKDRPKEGGIVVIGSGLAGVSTAYFLLEKKMGPVILIDDDPHKAASFRNCGHILHGTVESPLALTKLHNSSLAKDIWSFSVDICSDIERTVKDLKIDCEYQKEGYLVVAIDEAEWDEIQESVSCLEQMGFENELVGVSELENLGLSNVCGARRDRGSAQAHPVKFRNSLMKYCLLKGLHYHSGTKVNNLKQIDGEVRLDTQEWGTLIYDAAVIATNAYSPLLSQFYLEHQLVEPFRGQILTSKPLKRKFPISIPHSFDHGYEYALITSDQRLMIGGWRNNVSDREIGNYSLKPNEEIEAGLKNFVKHHYKIDETLEWEYSWTGVMASSRTGFPFIGPTSSPLIYTVAGFTGHGFSWAHGSAKLLVKIMSGDPIPEVAKNFDPRQL